MKRTRLIVGVICLALAAVVLLLGKTKVALVVGKTNVTVYPAVAFAD